VARPPRIDFADALYHVTSRGNGRAEIFWSDDRLETMTQLVLTNIAAKLPEVNLGPNAGCAGK
jgi:hypothetical protein